MTPPKATTRSGRPAVSARFTNPHRIAGLAGVALALAATTQAKAQNQSLAFTGGVLLNTKLSFGSIGQHPAPTAPGAAGGALDRTYDNGFVRPESEATPADTTANWGYQTAAQLQGSQVVMTSRSAAGGITVDEAADFISPSGHLEYRGSMGELGRATWGITLGIGYQSTGGSMDSRMVTEASVLEDSYSFLPGQDPAAIPAAPYAGQAGGAGVRLGAIPSRALRTEPGARLLDGHWELEAEMIPVTGGVYLESQIAGRLNAVASAGLLAIFVNADFKYVENSTLTGASTLVSRGADGSNDFVIGGFAQLGLDWALWENASLVASARWQPTETFSHSVGGREAELDFTAAFAVHAGFSMRF